MCNGSVTSSSDHPLRLECLHLVHPECLAKTLSVLPGSSAPSDYCCPQCKHPVLPEKWPLNSGAGGKIAAFLKQFPWGIKLLPVPKTPVSQPATPLRASMMGSSSNASPDVLLGKTPKTRSRKAGDTEVRLNVGADGEEEDKYSKQEGKRLTSTRVLLLLLVALLLLGVYLVMFASRPGGDEDQVAGAGVGEDAAAPGAGEDAAAADLDDED